MPNLFITGVRLKDGTRIEADPRNPRETHTFSQTLFWLTIRCNSTGAVRRIKWGNVAKVYRASGNNNPLETLRNLSNTHS